MPYYEKKNQKIHCYDNIIRIFFFIFCIKHNINQFALYTIDDGLS